ncbi:MAG: substrate-binding domain-containing protein [Chthonomonadales bacterium]
MKRNLVLLLALGTALAGCGKERAEAPGASTKPAASEERAVVRMPEITGPELDAVPRSKKPVKIALVVKTRNNPFFTPMIRAAEDAARRLGCELDVEAPPQESDKEQQFSLVQTVVAKGIQALLIAPADSKGIVPALKDAQAKGVLVINVDNRVDADTARGVGLQLGGYVGADNEAGGELAGQGMLEALNNEGKVAVLEGLRGVDNAEARKRGFEKAVRGKLEIVAEEEASWDTQKAYAKCQSVLAAHPDIKGIFCANDKMALGAMKAIKEAGKSGKIAVIGYDNIPDVKPYLSNGEMYGTIEQHPDLMGKYGVEMAVGVLNGVIPRGREYLVPLEFVR